MVLSGSSRKSDDYSSKEAIAAAKKILDERETFIYHVPGKLEAEFVQLDLYTADERFAVLDEALSEITEGDRHGPQPPNHISSPPYAGKTMYAFIWKSKTHGSIYLKFSFVGADKMAQLVLHSFHPERDQETL